MKSRALDGQCKCAMASLEQRDAERDLEPHFVAVTANVAAARA